MSDESSRSARPYGQRRNDGAPTWWAALDRADLPDNEVEPSAQRRWYEEAEPVAPQVPPVSRTEPARGHRGWLIGLLVTLAVALVLGIEQLMDPTGYVRDVTLLIAIPVGLAAAVTIFVARRSS
jgi:hypothetical protein